MSILIEGMEMPGNCAGCFMRISGCRKRIYQECRPKGCPLVEVPTPHGRLADADALLERLQATAIAPVPSWIRAEIIIAPTIIEAEE